MAAGPDGGFWDPLRGREPPPWATAIQHQIMTAIGELAGAVTTLQGKVNEMSADQQHLDTDVQALVTALTSSADVLSQLVTAVDALKAQEGTGTPLDFTDADAAVGQAQAVLATTQSILTDATTPPVPPTP
jgi:hypothetical protein